MARERLFLRPAAYRGENDTTQRTGCRIVEIHRFNRQARSETDDAVPYDNLVLTIGSLLLRLSDAQAVAYHA